MALAPGDAAIIRQFRQRKGPPRVILGYAGAKQQPNVRRHK